MKKQQVFINMMIKSDINLQIIFPGIVNPSYLKDPIHL